MGIFYFILISLILRKLGFLERKCTTNNDASASYEIVNVVQLTNLSTNKFALRPTFRY
jgi:hypothetical protein